MKRCCVTVSVSFVSICSNKCLEERTQRAKVLKIEYSKAYENNKLCIDMCKGYRHFLHALFAYEHFKEYEHSIVKSPENKVPACAVPKSCAEPYKEKSSVFSSFAEDREIKHIISEK